jgi:hypothetical protein
LSRVPYSWGARVLLLVAKPPVPPAVALARPTRNTREKHEPPSRNRLHPDESARHRTLSLLGAHALSGRGNSGAFPRGLDVTLIKPVHETGHRAPVAALVTHRERPPRRHLISRSLGNVTHHVAPRVLWVSIAQTELGVRAEYIAGRCVRRWRAAQPACPCGGAALAGRRGT